MSPEPADADPVLSGATAVVVTCSTRAARGLYADHSGPVAAESLRDWGLEVREVLVEDGPAVDRALHDALAGGPDLILTTGGTGLTPTDGTPEATLRVVDRQVPGIAEAIRAAGVAAGVPTAMLSRGVAGLAGRTLVVNLPGSTGGVRDAIAVLQPVLAHAISQIHGGDHR